MATYVNDLRLKEIGTGESSGTWGTETNLNLELIGEALGFGTEAITTNADTHTTTVADGSTDPGRAMYLKYTGTLDSACTYYVDVEPGCSPIVFESQKNDGINGDNKPLTIQPQNGMLLLWPALLHHEVPPTETKRMVVAMNIDKGR